MECQCNKGKTTRKAGPLHPLPIPERRGDSVAIDFVGPLPLDDGFDCIVTMTDRLGSDIQIAPTNTTVTAEKFAVIFDRWYCENGLPLDIISDRDKIFTSKFWKALHKLTGVKIKMSTAYHPRTDGSSERSNKTVNQCLRFHVRRNQKGWVRALPRVRFDIMNTVNRSTGFSGFQLKTGLSPRLMPPLINEPELMESIEAVDAARLVQQLEDNVAQAQDSLLMAKVAQAEQFNNNHGPALVFDVGDMVMLSTFNHRRDYKKKGEKRVAKFMPRFDGPYAVIEAHPQFSTYELELPNSPNIFPVFHTDELTPFIPNNASLFPGRELERPAPIQTEDGEEYGIHEIIDERRRGRGTQYLVRWRGYGPEEDRWIASKELDDCEALNRWNEGLVSGGGSSISSL